MHVMTSHVNQDSQIGDEAESEDSSVESYGLNTSSTTATSSYLYSKPPVLMQKKAGGTVSI